MGTYSVSTDNLHDGSNCGKNVADQDAHKPQVKQRQNMTVLEPIVEFHVEERTYNSRKIEWFDQRPQALEGWDEGKHNDHGVQERKPSKIKISSVYSEGGRKRGKRELMSISFDYM